MLEKKIQLKAFSDVKEFVKAAEKCEYDVDVFYQTVSVKELHFSGYMERYKDVSVILEAITLSTGVTFSIQGKTIIVSK